MGPRRKRIELQTIAMRRQIAPPREAEKRRKRLLKLCGALPEVDAEATGVVKEHLTFRVRKKTFAY